MKSLIKFRMLYDELDNDEQRKLIDSHEINFIITDITAIFNHFADSILNFKAFDDKQIQSMNNTISEIIHDRKSNHGYPDDQLNLSHLPPPLISYISSYLHQNNYIMMNRLNRRVFLGCATPFALQEMDITSYDGFDKCQVFDVTKFKEVAHILVTMKYFNFIMTLCTRSQFRNLRHLSLYNGSEDELNLFLNQKCIDLTNIEHLTFDTSRFINVSTFIRFLSEFPNLKYFDIDGDFATAINDDDWTDENIPFFPKLKGFDVYTTNFAAQLLKKHEMQIESIKLHDDIDTRLHDGYNSVPNLKELTLHSPNQSFYGIIFATQKLEMLGLDHINELWIKGLVSKTLVTQPNLECLKFWNKVPPNWSQWMSELKKGLRVLETPNLKKNTLNIILEFYKDELELEFKFEELFVAISEIINILSNCYIDTFIVEFSLPISNCDDIDIKEKLKQCNGAFLVKLNISENELQFAVSNKDNAMYLGKRKTNYETGCFQIV